MIMITAEDLAQAEAAVAVTERAKQAAGDRLSLLPHSQRAVKEALAAQQEAAVEARRLRLLKEEYAEQEATRAAERAAAEKAAAKEVRAAGRELTAGRERVTAAAVAAQDALAALVREVGAFNALTVRHADVLAAAGLGLEGGRNGGGREMSGPVVMVDGVAYVPSEQGAVVGAMVARLAASLPSNHRLAVAARYLPGGDRAAELLAGVPRIAVEWDLPVRRGGTRPVAA